MAGGKRQKAPCRAALLGERKHFFMLPRCVVDSAAYRDLSVHARAILIEIGVRLDGFNNGRIGISQRDMSESLRCSPKTVVRAIADLMDHGMIDVTIEGDRNARRAREYRLTFISTPNAPATNDYLRWSPQTPSTEKSGGSPAVAVGGSSASPAEATPRKFDSAAEARIAASRIETPRWSASPAVSHISKPYPPTPLRGREGDTGSYPDPLPTAAHRSDSETDGRRECADCGEPFTVDRPDRAHIKRFCSETCRKRAERARAAKRGRDDGDARPIGRIIAGGRQ